MIGTAIAHYTILEKIGEGGMGVVYKAQDTKLDRLVALKFLPPHLSASEQDRARFVQEAKAASAINHANICTIYSIDEHDGQFYIAMEYVEGQTLRERIDSISLKQAVEIGIQIADGLAAAHERGIIHRDIKPENIMIRKDGAVQIMDFGLAKLRGVSALTKVGSTVGTAGYMSPEQVQGQETDQRSDIFSLGVVLYELCTHQRPFKGVHETALLYEIVNVDARPMSAVNEAVDAELDRIVLACLEKDPNERTQSVKQVSVELRRLKGKSGGRAVSRITHASPLMAADQVKPERERRNKGSRKSLLLAIAAIIIVVLTIAAWLLLRSVNTLTAITRFSISLPKDESIDIARFKAIAISPDGSHICFTANGKLYQRRMDNFNIEPIPGTEEGSDPFFSPDGKWIGYFTPGKIKKIALSGGAPVNLADLAIAEHRGGTWSTDGSIIFTPGGTLGLFLVSQDGGKVRELTTLDTVRRERTHRWPFALPDGKTILCTIGSVESPDYYEDAAIAAVNIKTGEHKNLMSGASTAQYVPTGYLVYTRSGNLFAAPFDPDRLEFKGPSFPVIDSISGDQTTGAMNYASSGNGTLVWVPGLTNSSNRELAIADLHGSITTMPPQVGQCLEPSFSPDGKRIALVVQSGKDFDVWVYSTTYNTMNRLTFGGTNRSPIWSPDGRRIAYACNSANKNSVVIRQADGTGTVDEIPMDNRMYVNGWTHDGSALILSIAIPGHGWDLDIVPLSGDRKRQAWQATMFDEEQAALSPDGRWLSYVSRESGVSRVYVRPFPAGDGKWQITNQEAFEAHWSPDGRELYYTSTQAIYAVPINATQSIAFGQPRIVIKDFPRFSVESLITFDISPDGKHILFARAKEGEETPRQINVVLNWFDEIKKNVAAGK